MPAWVAFVPFAVLTVVGLFVLDGAASGAVLFVALLALIGGCIAALRRQDSGPDADRTGLAGWIGGWF
jgi:hypothetical protein